MNGGGRESRLWTARFVLRSAGAAALVIVVSMALLGAYVFDFTDSARSFFIYWTAFFVLLMGVILLAMFDAAATIVRFRKERTKLRKAFRHEFGSRHGDGS